MGRISDSAMASRRVYPGGRTETLTRSRPTRREQIPPLAESEVAAMAFIRLLTLSRGCLGWSLFAGFLVPLGWALHSLLPPQPRWTLTVDHPIQGIVSDGSALIQVREHEHGESKTYSLQLIDSLTGGQRAPLFEDCPQADFLLVSKRVHWDPFFPDLPKLPNGRFAFVLKEDCSLACLDMVNGDRWTASVPDGIRVLNLCFESPDGEVVLFGISKLGLLLLLDTKPERRHTTIPFLVANDLTLAHHRIVSQLSDTAEGIQLYDRRTGSVSALSGKAINKLSSSGRWIVTEEPDPMGKKVTLALWDFPGRKQRKKLGTYPWEVIRVVFSLDEERVAVWCKDHLECWDVRSGRLTSRVEVRCKRLDSDQVFSPDGRLLGFQGTNGFYMHEAVSGRLLWSAAEVAGFNMAHKGPFVIVSETGWSPRYKTSLRIADTGARMAIFDDPIPPLKPEEQRILVAVDRRRNLNWLEKQLKAWLPAGWFTDPIHPLEILGFDLEDDARQVFRFSIPYVSEKTRYFLAGQGNLLISVDSGDEGTIVTCWHLPPHRRWIWIIGVPAGLGLVVVGWRTWRNRKKSRACATAGSN